MSVRLSNLAWLALAAFVALCVRAEALRPQRPVLPWLCVELPRVAADDKLSCLPLVGGEPVLFDINGRLQVAGFCQSSRFLPGATNTVEMEAR